MPKLETSANFVAARAGNSRWFLQVCHGHKAGNVISKKRNRLATAKAEQRVFLMDNL